MHKQVFHVKHGTERFLVETPGGYVLSRHADIVSAMLSVKREPAGSRVMRDDGKLMAVRVPMRPTDRKVLDMLRES